MLFASCETLLLLLSTVVEADLDVCEYVYEYVDAIQQNQRLKDLVTLRVDFTKVALLTP